MTQGTIFDIKRYAIHDGPGIRTTIFFQGVSAYVYVVPQPRELRVKTGDPLLGRALHPMRSVC